MPHHPLSAEEVLLSTATCPKSMGYGPCGGVRFDGACEVADHRCVFVDVETVRWHGVRGTDAASPPSVPAPASAPASTPAGQLRRLIATRPIVVADFPARAVDAASVAECAAVLGGRVDAVLAGDSGQARVQFSPSYRAQLIRSAGLAVWSGLNCRDRNRVALAGELAGLLDAGASAVHCVTGDHTRTGHRPDAMPVFDLDSTELAALARSAGHLVSVGESPATPPVARRPQRLLEKQRAGAEICFVNHAGGVEPVRDFVAAARRLGVVTPFIACVPVVLDRGSGELLASFTSLALPDGYLDRVLGASDIRSAGIEASVELSRRLLEVDGVAGVNLSGGGAVGEEVAFAEGLAEIGDRLLS